MPRSPVLVAHTNICVQVRYLGSTFKFKKVGGVKIVKQNTWIHNKGFIYTFIENISELQNKESCFCIYYFLIIRKCKQSSKKYLFNSTQSNKFRIEKNVIKMVFGSTSLINTHTITIEPEVKSLSLLRTQINNNSWEFCLHYYKSY